MESMVGVPPGTLLNIYAGIVGTPDKVAAAIQRYIDVGFGLITFIGIFTDEDLQCARIYNCTSLATTYTWAKFNPIMDEWRRRYGGRDSYTNFEYVATEMLKKKMERDPAYRVPENLAKYVTNK